MLIHQLPLDAAFATVRSVPTGLSQADAAARRLEFGPNRIECLVRTPLVVRFLRQFTHFFAALLWVAARILTARGAPDVAETGRQSDSDAPIFPGPRGVRW